MAAKKKTKKKQGKTKKTAAKKRTPVKKLAKKNVSTKRKLAKKKLASKKASVRTKALGKKRADAKTPLVAKKPASGRTQSFDTGTFATERLRSRSAGQAGDLQGLSNVEGADSESVDELIEEGNAFEADAVAGVESAGDADEKEVHTHEVPEDDVPDEYLEKE